MDSEFRSFFAARRPDEAPANGIFGNMAFLKYRGEQLFTGEKMLSGHTLVARVDGTIEDIVPDTDAGEGVQTFDGILTPGFVNCHCHLELSHMAGKVPKDTGLVDFVLNIIKNRNHPEEQILASIAHAEAEMAAAGTVAVGDICNNALTLPRKQQRNLTYYNFIEVTGWMPAAAESRYWYATEVYEQFTAVGLMAGLSPHAPYSVSARLWGLLAPNFQGKTVTIHNQESREEDQLFRNGSGGFNRMYEGLGMDTSFYTPPGTSSLQHYLDRLSSARQVILVHNTFTTEEDILFAQASGIPVNWCLCINANRYIENTVPPAELLHRLGARIVIGTDSLASNESLSMVEEIRSLLQYFPSLSLETVLQWATRNGARALQMDDSLGNFSKGKKPGIVLINGLKNGFLTPQSVSRRIV